MRRGGARARLVSGLIVLALCPFAPAHAQAAGEWSGSEQLWSRTCSYCHNDGLAADLRGAGVARAAIIGAARLGPGGMPPFAPSVVSDAELGALAQWLAAQKKPVSDERTRRSRHGARQRQR